MDFQMPIMDGLSSAKAIKQMIAEKKIEALVIIGCSANDLESE